MTVRDLIRRSMMRIGVLAEGETPSSSQLQDALSSLNDLLDSWSIEGLIVYNEARDIIPLVGGQQQYTIGPDITASLNVARPFQIVKALIQTSTNPTNELPVDILNLEQWASIPVKDLQSSYSYKLYFEQTVPLATVNLWPIPSDALNLVLYSNKPLTNFATANDDVVLPPGYSRAIILHLGIELAPDYGKSISPEHAGQALEAKANIKRVNIDPQYMMVDEALLNTNRPFNWITGE